MRSHYCGLVTEALLGQSVTLCGWVNRRRDHGGVIFVDVRDREGYVQVVCDPDRADMFHVAEDVRNEFCIQVKGLVRARPEGTVNDNLKSGKIEVLCHELKVLNPSVTGGADGSANNGRIFFTLKPRNERPKLGRHAHR